MKRCPSCMENKDPSFFHKSAKSSDGLQGYCKSCQNNKNLEYRKYNQEKSKNWKRLDYLKHKEKRVQQIKKYRQENIDTIKQHARRKNQAPAEKEKKRAYNKLFLMNNSEKIKLQRHEYYLRNKAVLLQKGRARSRQHYLDNKQYYLAKFYKRRLLEKQAMPKWLTRNHLQQIEEWYQAAKSVQWLSIEPLHIDHIVPINGENVCGLHVPWNLQVLTRTENIRKSNKET